MYQLKRKTVPLMGRKARPNMWILKPARTMAHLHTDCSVHSLNFRNHRERMESYKMAAADKMYKALEVALRCPSIGCTDMVTGDTFHNLITSALEHADGPYRKGLES